LVALFVGLYVCQERRGCHPEGLCQAHRVVTTRVETPAVTNAPGGWYPQEA